MDDLEPAGARLGDVHVQPEVVLTRRHRRRPARAFGELRVVEGGDHVVLPQRSGLGHRAGPEPQGAVQAGAGAAARERRVARVQRVVLLPGACG